MSRPASETTAARSSGVVVSDAGLNIRPSAQNLAELPWLTPARRLLACKASGGDLTARARSLKRHVV